jgi:hypothetical protein
VSAENSEAVVAAIAGQRDGHREQRDHQRQAAGVLMSTAYSNTIVGNHSQRRRHPSAPRPDLRTSEDTEDRFGATATCSAGQGRRSGSMPARRRSGPGARRAPSTSWPSASGLSRQRRSRPEQAAREQVGRDVPVRGRLGLRDRDQPSRERGTTHANFRFGAEDFAPRTAPLPRVGEPVGCGLRATPIRVTKSDTNHGWQGSSALVVNPGRAGTGIAQPIDCDRGRGPLDSLTVRA